MHLNQQLALKHLVVDRKSNLDKFMDRHYTDVDTF